MQLILIFCRYLTAWQFIRMKSLLIACILSTILHTVTAYKSPKDEMPLSVAIGMFDPSNIGGEHSSFLSENRGVIKRVTKDCLNVSILCYIFSELNEMIDCVRHRRI